MWCYEPFQWLNLIIKTRKMGANAKYWLRLKMEEEHYQQLEHETRERMEIEARFQDEPEEYYSTDEMWEQFNKDAKKVYKLKKERERYLIARKDESKPND